MDEVRIRRMAPGELDAIEAVANAAFGDAATGRLIAELFESWAWEDELSFVAAHGDFVVGQVAYVKALLDTPSRLVEVLLLSPLSVLPAHQGSGIGGRLVSESLAALGDRPEPLIFVEGSPTFYGQLGFERASDHGFERPSTRIPVDAFRFVRLSEIEPWMEGRVVYPDVFWRHDAVGLRD